MRLLKPALLSLLLTATFSGIPAQAANPLAPVSTVLASQLASITGTIPVFVHGTGITAARTASTNAGLTVVTTWDRIGVAVARGTAAQIQAVRSQPGVTYVEGDQAIKLDLSTSHQATRGEQARTELKDAQGRPIDGRGVSAAIIDTGVDGTHPFFRNADGTSAVKLNLKNICGPLTDLGLPLPLPNDSCFANLTAVNDTDTLSLGGHGTHVAGIVAGRDTRLSDGTRVHGAAPAATIISLSVGAGLSIFGADSALNWVLEHHQNP